MSGLPLAVLCVLGRVIIVWHSIGRNRMLQGSADLPGAFFYGPVVHLSIRLAGNIFFWGSLLSISLYHHWVWALVTLVASIPLGHYFASVIYRENPVFEPGDHLELYLRDGLDAYAIGDYPTALKKLPPVAEHGNSKAQFFLGMMCYEGTGTPQNYAEAMKWYHLAAQQGDPKAQYCLGVMYNEGRGTMRNCAEAIEWYLLAAAQGLVKAQMELSGLFTKGDGVQQDDAQAFYWCSRAATQGEALAQCYLGSLYFRGKGVNQDYVLAYMYFSLAAAQDQEDAIRGRDLASRCMDAEQIAEAQRLAREWRSNQPS